MKPTNQRFYKDVVLAHDGKECLVWPFSKTQKGYPRMFWQGRGDLVTRLVCGYFYGPAPGPGRKYQAAHSCNNPSCVNWRHLRWTTPSGNEQDKIAHGTYQFGERNPSAKLTLEQVLEIRQAQGTYQTIAERYGVGRSAVSKIKRRERWVEFTG